MSISGNLVGFYSQIGKTFIIEDSDGNEMTGVVVGQETVFTATDNDVREGYVYAGDSGVSIGAKDIPIYRTYQSSVLVFPGEDYSITLSAYDIYDYTKFQGIISKFNTSLEDSVFTDKVIMNNRVYAVNSLEAMSNIEKNIETKSVNLNIVNDTEDIYIITFFTYKEEA